MLDALLTQYGEKGLLGLVAATALLGLIIVARLYVKTQSQRIADAKVYADALASVTERCSEQSQVSEKANREEMRQLLQEFVAASHQDREDYRRVIERVSSVLEGFLNRRLR